MAHSSTAQYSQESLQFSDQNDSRTMEQYREMALNGGPLTVAERPVAHGERRSNRHPVSLTPAPPDPNDQV